MSSFDYYEVLGLSRDAWEREIKKAYRSLSLKHHPDKNGGDDAKFKQINEAYNVLKDPSKKQQYDTFGTVGDQAWWGFGWWAGFHGFGSIFEDLGEFFGGQTGGGYQRAKPDLSGSDLKILVEISFLEATLGGDKEIEIDHFVECETCNGKGAKKESSLKQCAKCQGSGRAKVVRDTIMGRIITEQVCPDCNGLGERPEKPCSDCEGQGRVRKKEKIKFKIPVGIDDGQYVKLTGKGNAGMMGHEAGDFYVQFRVKSHPEFKREGLDVYTLIEIEDVEAVLGNKISIETIHGKTDLVITPETQHGDKIKIRGLGVKLSHREGNHIAVIKIRIPKKIDTKTRELYLKIAKERGIKLKPVKKDSLFKKVFG